MTNSLGFRDQEHSIVKSPGTYRIIILGDSIASGLKISSYLKTFPYLLSQKMNNQKKAIEVINFGVSGYNTKQEVAILEDKGLLYNPNLILLSYCLNDRERDDGEIYLTLLKQEKNSLPININHFRIIPFLKHSALYRFLRYKIFFNLQKKELSNKQQKEYLALCQDTVTESFKQLSTLAKQNDFQVLIVVFPLFENLSSYNYYNDHQYIKRLASTHQFYFLDLLPTFQKVVKTSLIPLSSDIYHPTAAGHRYASIAMANFIQQTIPPFSEN
ncbi:SGNH/GDSL hydrolase family protein [Candidatus Auribacterota bacterium]